VGKDKSVRVSLARFQVFLLYIFAELFLNKQKVLSFKLFADRVPVVL
jgi:hypothetical protein